MNQQALDSVRGTQLDYTTDQITKQETINAAEDVKIKLLIHLPPKMKKPMKRFATFAYKSDQMT